MRRLIFLIPLMMVHTISKGQQPAWLDTAAYPFQPHFFDLPQGRMHYVDEGQGEPIVFVHGTPAWSFLYREQIKALSKNHRCITPDHLGFGLSDKPAGYDYKPESLANNLEALLNHLELDSITLVVHDFGGPIGLEYALRNPQKIRRLVILNTWMWATNTLPDAQKADKLLHSWLGRFLYLNRNASPKLLLKKAFYDKTRLTKSIHHQYTMVHGSKSERYGLLRIGQNLVGSSDFYATQWQRREVLSDKPMLILWGMHDPFLKPEMLEKWTAAFPQAKVQNLESGHFIQEEMPEAVTKVIGEFMKER